MEVWAPRENGIVVGAVEQCWRDLLGAFGLAPLLPRRAAPTVSFHCCAQFFVSRAALRRHPREAYEAALSMVLGGDGGRLPGVCHAGALDTAALSPLSARAAARAPGGGADAPVLNKHTSGAFEHLQVGWVGVWVISRSVDGRLVGWAVG